MNIYLSSISFLFCKHISWNCPCYPRQTSFICLDLKWKESRLTWVMAWNTQRIILLFSTWRKYVHKFNTSGPKEMKSPPCNFQTLFSSKWMYVLAVFTVCCIYCMLYRVCPWTSQSELQRFTYTWIFFNKYVLQYYIIHVWVHRYRTTDMMGLL